MKKKGTTGRGSKSRDRSKSRLVQAELLAPAAPWVRERPAPAFHYSHGPVYEAALVEEDTSMDTLAGSGPVLRSNQWRQLTTTTRIDTAPLARLSQRALPDFHGSIVLPNEMPTVLRWLFTGSALAATAWMLVT